VLGLVIAKPISAIFPDEVVSISNYIDCPKFGSLV